MFLVHFYFIQQNVDIQTHPRKQLQTTTTVFRKVLWTYRLIGKAGFFVSHFQ